MTHPLIEKMARAICEEYGGELFENLMPNAHAWTDRKDPNWKERGPTQEEALQAAKAAARVLLTEEPSEVLAGAFPNAMEFMKAYQAALLREIENG